MAIQFLNTVAVDTNVLYVDTSSDRVGIGTSNPDAKLHIESTAAIGANLILETTHSGGIPLLDLKGAHSGQLRYKDELNIIQGRIDFGDSGTFNFIDVPNNSSTLYLKTGGNVGIGTSNPTTPLEIVSSDNTLLYLNSSTASVYLRLDDANSTNGNFIGATTDDMHFWTNNTERMRIDSSGNVQIGAGTRFGKFDILNVGGSGTNFIVGAGSNGDNYYTSGTSGIQVFRTGSTERMRIGSAGQIGIGGANYGTSGQVLTSNGSSSAPSWQTPSTGDITGVTAGSYMTGGGTSGTVTLNANASVNATANTLAARTSSGDIYARLLRATYPNQSTISGAIAFRVNNGTDNYTRYCSSPAAIRSFIGAGTGSGDITSVTAGAYLSGGATSGNATVNLDVGGSGNWWGKGAAVGGDGVMEVGKYIDFHDTNTATNEFDYRLTSSGGRLYLSGDLEVDGGDIYINDNNTRITEGANNSVRIQTNSGYVDIGPANSSYSHFYTDRGQYYFNKGLTVDTGQVRSYNEDLNLNRAGSTTARLRITSGTTISDQALQSASTVRSQFNSGDYAQLESNGSGGVIKAVSSTSTTVLFRSYGDSYILNDLGIGTTSPSARLHVESTTSTTSSNILRLKSLTASSGPFIRMIDFVRSNNSTRGYIAMNQYSVQYNSTSDYRLKRNVTPMENSIDRIKLLKPSRFNWVEGPDDYVVDGFIAHEVQDVVHDAVSGEKDAVDENNEPAYQGIDQSKLVPLLTAALQDAITKIEQLETRIQTLEDN